MTKVYNKLVRDRIPAIITESGKSCTTRILEDGEYLGYLDEKLNEELAEYQQSKSLEELADLMEVIRAVVKARGFSLEELEAIRSQKAAQRGGFEEKIFLMEVRTTGVAGGLHWPYKGLLLACASRHLNDSPTAHNLLAAPYRGRLNYLPLPTGSPVNGSLNSRKHI